MKKNYVFYLFVGLSLLMSEAYSQTYDFEELRNRVVQSERTGISGNLDAWVSSQNYNGSWDGLPYHSNSDGSGENHLNRLWNLAAACTQVGHDKYNDPDYKHAIKKGLEFWYISNTYDSSWWFNKVYYPQRLGELLIFLREFDGFIPQTSSPGIDEPELLSLFNPQSISEITSHGNGANAVDIALHYVYRGLLLEDASLLEDTRDMLESVLGSNIKGDMVYQDHGPQIVISSYGWGYCNGLVKLSSFLADSPAEFNTTSGNFNRVLQFIRETQISSARGNTWDFSVNGRSVSRVNGLNASLNYLEKLAQYIDTDNAAIYNDALARLSGEESPSYNIREFNKHYWASDYTQHARSGYLLSVRNTSDRTVEAETGNSENLKANYFSYGATNILIDGDEYKEIRPYWDWAMIPGTTYPHFTTFPSRSNWGTNFGNTSFVGGVSNGEYGASTLDMDEEGIKAKKSWFFFEDEMVCLGDSIRYSGPLNVRTTINQTKLITDSYINEVGSSDEVSNGISESTYANTNLKYLRSGKVGYYFPQQGNIKYTMKLQSGTWESINGAFGPSDTQSGDVLSLWVDHGSSPTDASYSYIVVPGIDNQTKAQNYNMDAIEIVKNTGRIQAVYHNTLNILEAIFHEAGTINFNGKTLTVDKPCALMLVNDIQLTVSSPSQNESSVSVQLSVNGITETIVANLPTDNDLKGSSVTNDFSEALLSLNSVEFEEGLKIYPNPTKGSFIIESKSSELIHYSIITLDGKKVAHGEFSGTGNINLSNHNDGIYFIKLQSKYKTVTQKIVKY